MEIGPKKFPSQKHPIVLCRQFQVLVTPLFWSALMANLACSCRGIGTVGPVCQTPVVFVLITVMACWTVSVSLSLCLPALHSTQFEGPAPEEESPHVPAQRLAGPEWKHQRARLCGGQDTQQGNALIKQ